MIDPVRQIKCDKFVCPVVIFEVLVQKVVNDAFALALLFEQVTAALVAAVAVLPLIYKPIPGILNTLE